MYSVTDLFGKDCPTKKPTRYGCRQKNLKIGDTDISYPYIKENRPWEVDKMDWYDLREHADAMSDFIQKLYNYI